MIILFLDFDGVQHSDEVYYDRMQGIVLRTEKVLAAYRSK